MTNIPLPSLAPGDAASAYRDRLRTQRLPPRDGQGAFETLKTLALADHPNAEGENPSKWNLFSQILLRCTYDTAGNLFARNAHDDIYSFFDEIFAKADYETVMRHLPRYTKGIVQTPHPTEMLGKDAIDREQELHEAIEKCPALFAPGKALSGDDKQALKEKMEALLAQMHPLTQGMSITQEMTRSIVFSERMFNAVPIIMQSVLDASVRQGKRDPQTPLSMQELSRFHFVMEPHTWSPGDRDSKDQMTADILATGIASNREKMLLHYVTKIAELIAHPATPETAAIAHSGEELQVKGELRTMLWKLLKDDALKPTGGTNAVHALVDKLRGNTLSDAAAAEILSLNEILVRTHDNQALREAALPTGVRLEEEAYNAPHEFLADLEALRESGARFAPYNGSPLISKLDALTVQAENFGFSALRSQIRENAEMHRHVIETIVRMFHDQGIAIPGYDPADPASAHREETIGALLDKLLDDPALGARMRADIATKLARDTPDVRSLYSSGKTANRIDPETEAATLKKVRFVETLGGFKLAAENPEAVPKYLIAECGSGVDVLEAFFMLKLMEKEPPSAANNHRGVDIVPLVEYRDHVTGIVDIMNTAFRNKHFRAHHQALCNPLDPAVAQAVPVGADDHAPLDDLNPALRIERGAQQERRRPLTVKEVKELYLIRDIRPGDAEKPIRYSKMVMYAGSDTMKSAGPAAAALVQDAIERTREAMLNMDEPMLLIDYTGSGGGIHRSQPVSTSFETVQGRSMRQTAESIAQKAVITMGRFIKHILGIEDRTQSLAETIGVAQRGILAQLNFGNMAGLPSRPELWGNYTKKRVHAWIDAYQEMYRSPEFAAFMGFSADKFVKLTSYAARSAARVGAKKDTSTWPPLIDVDLLRAIGYGAALNNSGSCASLYYGAGKFFNPDGKDAGENAAILQEIYQNDPKAQDAINRATWGVVMANMDTAWEYLGCTRRWDAATDTVHITLPGGGEVTAQSLAESRERVSGPLAHCKAVLDAIRAKDTGESGVEAAVKDIGWDRQENQTQTLEEKRSVALYAMAKIEMEYQAVSKGLLKLHRVVRHSGNVSAADARREAAAQLLDELPAALRSEIRESKKHIDPEREKLAQRFAHSLTDTNDPLRTADIDAFRKAHKQDYEAIYFSSATLNECFENAPRAITRPSWGVALEGRQGLSPGQ